MRADSKASLPQKPAKAQSTASGFAQDRIEPVDIRSDLIAAALVDDLAPHHTTSVGLPGAGRSQLAPHAVDTLSEHNLYPFGALVQNHDLHGLAAFGHTDGNLFVVHTAHANALWGDTNMNFADVH